MKIKLVALIGVLLGIALVAMAVRSTPSRNDGAVAFRPPTAGSLKAAAPSDGVRRTSPSELASMLARGEVIVIDVRDVDSYLAGHIEGALQIPLSYIAGEAPYLRRGKPIVTYCT